MPLRIVDSHTGGEPTRLIVAGGPDLAGMTPAEARDVLASRHDHLRRGLCTEPRGSDVIVGGIVFPPVRPGVACGVVFFNNVGYLGMCGHGTIGLAATLGHLGTLTAGRHRIDTPVGPVRVDYDGRHTAAVTNVPAFRTRRSVTVVTAGGRNVVGEIAWGGNWFFLTDDVPCPIVAERVPELTAHAAAIRAALDADPPAGTGTGRIDHIELCQRDGPTAGRSFVLCPGGEYDRSPCGTGTSAKLAALAADGALDPGRTWTQTSVIGSRFTATYRRYDATIDPPADVPGDADPPVTVIVPTITGTAYVTLDATVVAEREDPFGWGLAGRIPPSSSDPEVAEVEPAQAERR